MTEPKNRRNRLYSALILMTCLAVPRVAIAQDAAALLDEGKKLMAEGKLDEACPKLEESHKVSPNPSALYQVAVCHEKQGKIATAYIEFIDAEAEARKAGNKALQADARAKGGLLESRIPRLTVKVPKEAEAEGLEIRVDGAPLDRGSWNRPAPVNPGKRKVTVSAPGRKPWEKEVYLKLAGKESVTVPALAADGSAPAAAPAAAPGQAGPTAAAAAGSAGGGAAPAAPVEPEVTTHQASRFVVDVGVGPAFVMGWLDRGSVSTITSYDYEFETRDVGGTLVRELAVCNNDICEATYENPTVGVAVGGQAFFGYALTEGLQLGGRLFGGYRFGGGYMLVGGPSGSFKVGPVWAGASVLVGGIGTGAKPTGVKGEIPQEDRQYNRDEAEVDVKLENKTPLPESEVVDTFAVGGAIEVSYPLLDMPSGKWYSGALMVSGWPTFLKGIGIKGFAVSVPVTLTYRFY